MQPNRQFPAHLWFICLRVCMFCFVLRVFCTVMGGAREPSFGLYSLGVAGIPSRAAAYYARGGGVPMTSLRWMYLRMMCHYAAGVPCCFPHCLVHVYWVSLCQ